MKGKVSYQSIYANLPDDDEFITLSPLAKALWYTLKVKLPATGIGLINHRVVATLVNCSLDELAAAEAELSPKWIRRERNLWWIIAGLRFQPSLNFEDRKHRAFVQKQADALPDCETADAFRSAYADWLIQPKGHGSPSEGASKGHGSNVEGSSLAVSCSPDEQPPEVGPVQTLVLERVADPRAQAAVTAFMERVPRSDQPEFWALEVNGWLDGLNTPKGKEATPEHIRAALEEFNRKVDPIYDPPLVRGFLRRTMTAEQRAPPPGAGAASVTGTRPEHWTDKKAREEREDGERRDSATKWGNVEQHILSRDDGRVWWTRMQREAKSAGRNPVLYAYERMKAPAEEPSHV